MPSDPVILSGPFTVQLWPLFFATTVSSASPARRRAIPKLWPEMWHGHIPNLWLSSWKNDDQPGINQWIFGVDHDFWKYCIGTTKLAKSSIPLHPFWGSFS